jgi:hypothetical protein
MCETCPQGRYGDTTGLNSTNCTGFCKPGRYNSNAEVVQTQDMCVEKCFFGQYRFGAMNACVKCPKVRVFYD